MRGTIESSDGAEAGAVMEMGVDSGEAGVGQVLTSPSMTLLVASMVTWEGRVGG